MIAQQPRRIIVALLKARAGREVEVPKARRYRSLYQRATGIRKTTIKTPAATKRAGTTIDAIDDPMWACILEGYTDASETIEFWRCQFQRRCTENRIAIYPGLRDGWRCSRAETAGFEPAVPLRGLHLSRVVHSTGLCDVSSRVLAHTRPSS